MEFHSRNTTILDLSGNTFSSIPETAFNLTKLQMLNLGGCGITELPPNLFKGLANLRALYLEGNRIETLKRDTFSGITFVPERGLSCLGYRKGCMLDLRKNPIRSINTGAFRSTVRPWIIIGDEPNTTLTIENRTFESLQEANIVINNVADLVFKPFAFDGCSEPGLIRIRNSGIAKLHDFAFSGIDRIKEFEIRNCSMGEFPRGLFHKTSFYGESNQLSILWSNITTEIPHMAFFGTGVRSIMIAYNTMRAFGNFVFFGMKLSTLDIESNKFTHQNSLRMELNGIKEASSGIYIRNNSFNAIDKDAFLGCSNISRLYIMDHHENFTISAFAFRGLSNVKFLDFDGMKSLRLEKDSLAGINITRIRFYRSNITKFDPNAIDTCMPQPGFTSLTFLDLDSPPLPCDCFAAGLANFCRLKNISCYISCHDGETSRSVAALDTVAKWNKASPALPTCTATSVLTCPRLACGASEKNISQFVLATCMILGMLAFPISGNSLSAM